MEAEAKTAMLAGLKVFVTYTKDGYGGEAIYKIRSTRKAAEADIASGACSFSRIDEIEVE